MTNTDLHRHYLNDELARRCERNPSYSLRAFAKALGIDAGTLSKILNGTQPLSFKMAEKILPKLELAPAQQTQFFQSLAQYQGARKLQRVQTPLKLTEREYKGDDLSIEYYRVIADWYHIALMEMTFLKGFRPEPRYLAQELGIGVMEAKLALERLISLGLLEKKNGKIVKAKEKLSTTDRHLTTPALRKNQKQFLEKAIHSLENDQLEERSHTNMTMAIDSSKMEIAKKMIREFQMALCNYLESGKRDRVFNLSIALYPVQKKKEST
jgi:uncharacterized protein (TIGR02147 family)